jgi:DNA-binding PadR family transcriptional regulator
MKKRRPPSELEGCVLGVIGLEEPVSAYAIGAVFINSPNPQWSGSAGAIYPLVGRLHRSGLVRSTKHSVGRRRSKMFSLTRAGRKVFEAWLGPPVIDPVGGVPPDPLRTRVRFLELLSPGRRVAFLRSARASVNYQMQVVQADCKRWKSERGFRYMMSRGALASMEARHRWLREVEIELSRKMK